VLWRNVTESFSETVNLHFSTFWNPTLLCASLVHDVAERHAVRPILRGERCTVSSTNKPIVQYSFKRFKSTRASVTSLTTSGCVTFPYGYCKRHPLTHGLEISSSMLERRHLFSQFSSYFKIGDNNRACVCMYVCVCVWFSCDPIGSEGGNLL
jgi:hypothetical protein